ncbi:hypothetical protein EDB80DRAFT_823003 [Ilyonectria destructans]|nr:hypothetical protein EDB80DRAFT_823003 [Ilyonectria destructans]
MIVPSQSLYLTKFSILLLYVRIFTRSAWRFAIYVVGVIVGVAFVYCMVITFLACTPLRGFWEPVTQTCLSNRYWIASTSLHLGTDLLATVLPFPIVWTLNMRVMDRVILSLMFALGFLVTITSFLRLYYSMTSVSVDATWASILPTYWACLEINTAIFCACLMTLRPLLEKCFPKLLLSTLSSRLQSNGYPSARSAATQTTESQTERRRESSWTRMNSGDSVDGLVLQGTDQGSEQGADQSVIYMSPLTKVHTNHS